MLSYTYMYKPEHVGVYAPVKCLISVSHTYLTKNPQEIDESVKRKKNTSNRMKSLRGNTATCDMCSIVCVCIHVHAQHVYLRVCRVCVYNDIVPTHYSTHLDENGHDQNGDEEEDELLQVPCAPQDPLTQSHHEH